MSRSGERGLFLLYQSLFQLIHHFQSLRIYFYRGLLLILAYIPLFSTPGTAENVVLVPVVPSTGFYYLNNQNQIKNFDDDFFVTKKLEKSAFGVNGQGRYYGVDLPYHSAQRAEWIEQCEPERAKGNKAFRQCFELKKQQSQAELNQRFQEVNARSAEPLRNQSPLPKENLR